MGILQKVEKNVALLLMSSQSNGDGLAISGAEKDKALSMETSTWDGTVVNQDTHIAAWRRHLPLPLINLLNPVTGQPAAIFKMPVTFTASKVWSPAFVILRDVAKTTQTGGRKADAQR